jgi:hypothetical protein
MARHQAVSNLGILLGGPWGWGEGKIVMSS